MHRPLVAFALFAIACQGDKNAAPEELVGTWQLHQVEIATGEVDATEALLPSYPGCLWGRQIWSFSDDGGENKDGKRTGHLEATTDILCPVKKPGGKGDEYYGCTVTARVPASWDVAKGAWIVTDGTQARARTLPLDTAAIQGPTACEARVDAGEYPVARVRGEKWRWEMRTPDGAVVRLRTPDTERPDYVTALLEHKAAERAASNQGSGSEPANEKPE